MKQIIDINNWDRKDNFLFFQSFLNPQISITSEIDCTEARNRTKENGESFFLYYLYAILRACNEIKEFRYRITKKEDVVLYDHLDALVPILEKGTSRFTNTVIPYEDDFRMFYQQAKALINNIPSNSQSYDIINEKTENDELNFILLSPTPELHFTSIAYPQQTKHGSDYPLMNAGKAILRDGRWFMPIALSAHHGFIDGFHISQMLKNTQDYLKSIAS